MTGKDILQKVLSQITSGRWIITVAAAFCLILLTKTLCVLLIAGKVILEASTYIAVVMSILNTIGLIATFYFQKNRSYEENGNGDTTTTTTKI